MWFAFWPAVRRRTNHLSGSRRALLGIGLLGALLAPDADAFQAFTSEGRITEFHNYGSHSLLMAAAFAVPFAIICRLIAGGDGGFFWMIGFLAYSSHVLIDALTFGRGVQMFWPLTETRYGGWFYLFYGVRHSVNAPLWHHAFTALNDLAFAAVIFIVARWAYSRRPNRPPALHLERIDTRE